MKRINRFTKKPFASLAFQKFLIFSLILFLALTVRAQDKIIGGSQIDISTRPFQVSIEYFDEHSCSGAILNEEWVLTAGHCFNLNVPAPEYYSVHAGATDQTDNSIGQRVEVAEVIFHPLWDAAAAHIEYGPDLALVRLKTPLCFGANVQPIAYATPQNVSEKDLAIGTVVSLSGWGQTTDQGLNSAVLMGGRFACHQ